MTHKHVYLIMAHNHIENVKELLFSVDDARNDVFLHIDSKSLDREDWDSLHMEHGNLYRIPSMSVHWGGYSQVACTLSLMEHAQQHGPYQYYHFMCGATYPLKSQDEIHDFFDKYDGQAFLTIDKTGGEKFYHRVRYLYPWNEHGLNYIHQYTGFTKLKERLQRAATNLAVRFQQIIRYDHFKPYQLVHKKGLAYWSLPEDCIQYCLERKDLIRSIFRYSHPADESFMQTMLYNSPFKDSIYKLEDDCSPSLFETTWKMESEGKIREGHAFIEEDLDLLLSSSKLFARKLIGEEGLKLSRAISQAAKERTKDR